MSDSERLQKYLARCGVGSRRACEELISAGRVLVNGELVTRLGTTVDPEQGIVTVDGAPVVPESKFVYIALNKPKGVLTSASDQYGRPVVTDLVSNIPQRVFPVGRLDMDSEGLLLLTNDGELAYRLTHPKYQVPKTYLVAALGELNSQSVRRLKSGVELEDGVTSPAEVKRYSPGKSQATITRHAECSYWFVTIHEGRKRQVRRMFDAIGHPVRELLRVRFGPIPLRDLAPGSYKLLSREEVEQLRREVGMTLDN